MSPFRPMPSRGVLEALPEGAAVLIQKPFGCDLADARRLSRSAARAD
jgi:predicted dehydrogenase